MASSNAFEWLCQELETVTSLERLEARGTVRVALKQAGLDAASVTGGQLTVVLARVLPAELAARGIDDAEALCRQLGARLGEIPTESQHDTPEAIFARLGG